MPRAVFLSLLLALAPALAAPVPKDFANPRGYFPTAVGAKWEYVTTGIGKDQTHTEEITAAADEKGTLRVTIRRDRPNVATPFETVYTVGDKDISLTKSGPAEYDPPLPCLRKGMKPGDNWEIETAIGKAAKSTTFLFKVGEAAAVKTPAGTFVAVPVTRTTKGSKLAGYTYWYAPEVGLVKTDLTATAATVLTKYTPGKEAKK